MTVIHIEYLYLNRTMEEVQSLPPIKPRGDNIGSKTFISYRENA
jgi:hypothetical protein